MNGTGFCYASVLHRPKMLCAIERVWFIVPCEKSMSPHPRVNNSLCLKHG